MVTITSPSTITRDVIAGRFWLSLDYDTAKLLRGRVKGPSRNASVNLRAAYAALIDESGD